MLWRKYQCQTTVAVNIHAGTMRREWLKRILQYNEHDCQAMMAIKGYFEKRWEGG